MISTTEVERLNREFAQSVVRLPSGAQISVRTRGTPGQRPSVLLLHGISSGAASWLHTVSHMAPHTHVVAWDAPGYGTSTPLASTAPTADDYAAQLNAMVQALGLSSTLVVGHSLGCLMGTAYARQSTPPQVPRLVLISPAGGYGAPGKADAQARVRVQRQEALETHGVEGIAARIDQRLLSPNATEEARAWVRWNASLLKVEGYLQAVELLCGADLGAGTALQMPVEVHCGAMDVVTTPEASALWAQVLGATYAPIVAAGHASPTEQPEAVALLIERALAACE
jgi:pimeloyl-ACP methyl ester carboxylesterase